MKKLHLLLLVLISLASNAQNSKNWKAIKVPMQQTDNLYFWSVDSGFALDGKINALFKTVDGGQTWNKIKQFNEAKPFIGVPKLRITYISPDIIYYTFPRKSLDPDTQVIVNYWFCRSYDGGATWEENIMATPGYITNFINGLYFQNKNKGIIAQSYQGSGFYPGSDFYYTEDGGKTLNYIHPGADTRDGDGYAFFMGEKIFIGGNYRYSGNTYNKILMFKDWDSLKAGVYTYLINSNNSYDLNDSKLDDNWMRRFNFDYSDDGGNTFKPQTPDFMKSYSIGPNPTFQHFNNEIIYKADNGYRQESYIKNRLDYYFFDIDKFYQDTCGYPYFCNVLFIADSNTGYVGTDTSFILKTIDAGGSREFRTLLSTGIKNENTLVTNGIKLYPNPATNQLNVLNNQDKQEIKYGICSMQGQCLLDGMLAPSQSTIDISPLASGMYIFKTNFGISKFTVTK